MPLYCCFIHTADKTSLVNWECPAVPENKELWGCSIINAFTVRMLRTLNIKHLSELEPYLRPWHCLVCCRLYGGLDNIERIENYLFGTLRRDQNALSDFNINAPDSLITQSPPEYVLDILENETNAEIQPPDDDVAGIALIEISDNAD